MKKKHIVMIITIAVIGFLIGFFTYSVRADSGWDSDYDSGWSDSGSSWDSDWGSSSSDWGSSSSGHYSSSGSSSISIIHILILLLFIYLYIKYGKRRGNTFASGGRLISITKRVLESEIQQVIPDFNKKEFLEKSYQIFLDVQNAWMEFDYDTLRKNLSDELYNSYKSQLKALNALKQKNIMSDFDRIDIDISEFEYNDNKLTIKVELVVAFYDFVANEKNIVVRGRNDVKITNHYELTFISSVSKKDKPNKCPNCNAPLDNVASSTCPYCKSTIVSNHYDWVMSKKQIKKG